MRRAGWGCWAILLALAGIVGLLPAFPGRAQTEIEKSAPEGRPPQQSEIKKGTQDHRSSICRM
jgi:hypothetical protein